MANLQSIQAVAFLTAPQGRDATSWWAAAFRMPHQSFQSQSPGQSTASGLIDGFFFEITAQLNRIDLQVRPANGQDLEAAELAPKAFNPLLALLSGIPVNRVSLVAVSHLRAADQADAAAKFSEQVPGVPAKATFSDQLFQLNEVISSSVQAGLSINRLSRWSVGYLVEFKMEVPGAGGVPSMVSDQSWLIERVFDVNTVPNPLLDMSKLPQVFAELMGEVEALIASGISRYG